MKHFETRAIHSGQEPDAPTGAIIPPIYATSTFVQLSPGVHKGYEYSRTKNPTRTALEQCLASLEATQYAFAFSSGMAAIHSLTYLLQPNDHIVACDDLYGGTRRIFDKVFQSFGISCTYVDFQQEEQIRNSIRPETKLLWIETPTNPLLRVYSLPLVGQLSKEFGLLFGIDNTFATPYLQNPVLYGADIIIHSTTKYLGGHSDIIGGALLVNRDDLREKIAFYQNATGAVPSPFDCWLTLRGIKTLALRMQRHCDNAERIVAFLQKHPKVKKVFYPSFSPIAQQQMKRFGGMISFEVDSEEQAKNIVSRTRIFSLAESLGGVESLIEHPASMTHSSISPEIREIVGISPGLIRLSVGIEHIDDLIEDLENALK